MAIPFRIIQTAKSSDLSPLAKAAVSNLKLLHPGWEYLFFDDDGVTRFIHSEFPQYQEVFRRFQHPIQRLDFFRYLAVLRFGGFYFDLDVLLSEAIADLNTYSCAFPFEELTVNSFLRRHCNIDWELGNYGFGAAPAHPFIAAIVENCMRAVTDAHWCTPLVNGVPWFVRSEFIVLNTTGPGLVTRTFAEGASAASDIHIVCAGDMFEPANWHRFGRYGVHLMQASWRDRRGAVSTHAIRAWESVRRRRYMSQSKAAISMQRPASLHSS